MAKNALITGITGQDGSYLAELLLKKGYNVFGLVRRLSTPNPWRIRHLLDRIELIDGDMTDSGSIIRAIKISEPDEVYNLAAQSFVATSWKQPVTTSDITAIGTTRILDALRETMPQAKFYQASTSEMYGNAISDEQCERTEFHPRSPYAISKLYSYWMTVNYRESYKMFACNGILFNHESPRRGIEFVTRKITDGVARIKLGKSDHITLGNLDARRDWGDAQDYVEAMWMMLQHKQPDDYVVSTGVAHSVRDFVEAAFEAADIELDFKKHIKQDPRFMRPAELHALAGNCAKIKELIGWKPKTGFKELVKKMVDADIERVRLGIENEK